MEQKKENKAVSYRDLNDEEFIQNLDKLAQGYRQDYFTHEVQPTAGLNAYLYETSTDSCTCHKQAETLVQPVYSEASKLRMGIQKKDNGYTKRSVFSLILLLLLSLAAVFSFICEYVVIEPVTGALTIYQGLEKIYFFDGVTGFIANMTQALSSPFAEDFAQEGIAGVFAYLMMAATVLYAVLTVVLFVKTIVALCDKKGEDGYRKRNFGGIGFLMILCSLLISLYPLMTEKYAFGYGLIVVIGVSILTYVLSWTIYRKK